MILAFGDNLTEKIWTSGTVKIHPDLKNKALIKLFLIDFALQLDYLTHPPGNKLKKLLVYYSILVMRYAGEVLVRGV